jgi:peptidoglycan/LPS O-acetylase OafA/YrhL
MKKVKEVKKLSAVYFENLDALRFFAFFAVFLQHIFKNSSHFDNEPISRCFMNGNLGVNFFFVLSGFLITYLLLKEKEQAGKIAIGSFYMRRALRIWLGTISYGLYCYHMIIIYAVGAVLTANHFNTRDPGGGLFTFEAITSFVLSIAAAALSYRYIEKRFLRYKAMLSPAAAQ